MKNFFRFPYAFLFVLLVACADTSSSTEITDDTMPVVTPPVPVDTSRIITPAPTGDSNVVNPDSSVESR